MIVCLTPMVTASASINAICGGRSRASPPGLGEKRLSSRELRAPIGRGLQARFDACWELGALGPPSSDLLEGHEEGHVPVAEREEHREGRREPVPRFDR